MAKAHAAIRVARGKGFRRGFLAGLAAPVLLFSGTFVEPLALRRTSLADSWQRVGGYLRTGMDQYQAASRRGTTD